MNKSDYFNPIRNQVMSLPQLARTQVESCYDGQKLQNLMSIAEIFDARKIILTGCGDSHAAASAMQPVLDQYAGVFNCQAMDSMEFCRFTPKEDLGIGEPNSPFVFVISANGGTARVSEALEKAQKSGALAVLLTNNPQSRAAGVAERVYLTDTPGMENDFPGLRSYFASLVGLSALACRMGHVRGILPPTAPEEWQQEIIRYIEGYADVLDEIDSQMFELAKTWHTFERFNFIGDGRGLYAALFSLEKFYECTGVISNYDDSENWCHVDFFLKDPQSIGTVVYADKHSPSFGRVVETIGSAAAIGRPVLVVTNADRSAFCDGVSICTLPDPKPGFEWMLSLMDYAPASILAGYCSTLGGRKFFNSYDYKTNVYDRSNAWFAPGVSTMSSSAIEIHE